MREIRVKFNKVFREYNRTRKRYRLAKGSAGSGKSMDTAQDYIIKLSDPAYKGANLLCVRKIEGSNRNSTFSELQKAIYKVYGAEYDQFWKITKTPLEMTSLVTGNQIIFRGIKDDAQREKVKSITFPTGQLVWIWIEEATELDQADVEILDDRLRGDLDNPNLYYQITFTFNPVSASHWIKKIYFDRIKDTIFTCHSTYLDNRFCGADYHRRMEERKETDPEGYRVYGLGEWGETGGLILTNYVIEDFDIDPKRFDYMVNAQDFGFNHANALGEIGFKDGELYVCREIYEFGKHTSEIIQMANEQGFRKNIMMWCDSAEPDRIKMWQEAGYLADGVDKGGSAGSVKAQIDYLQSIKIHIHAANCPNTAKEIQQWKWKRDETTVDKYLDIPVPFMDDAMAMLRYSVEDLRRSRKAKVKKRPKGL